MNNHTRTRIKICGVRSEEIARAAVDAGADALGFVFAPSSPRFIEPHAAARIIAILPPFVASVGVTVDLPADRFAELQAQCPTDYHQLHGCESVQLAGHCPANVIKAIHFDPTTIDDDLARWRRAPNVRGILIDGSTGGLGVELDFARLAPRIEQCDTPILLAGGLTPDTVAECVAMVHPYAVDVSSGVERERGVKDAGLIGAFCDAVHEADRQ